MKMKGGNSFVKGAIAMLLLAAVLAAASVTICSSDADVAIDFTDNGIDYRTQAGNRALVIGYHVPASGVPVDLVIPSTVSHDGVSYRVTQISSASFMNITEIRSVTIPNTVVEIWNDAFMGCTGLTALSFEEGVSSSKLKLDYNAFAGCTGLTEIELPSHIYKLMYNVFEGCSSVDTVKIRNGSFSDSMLENESFKLGSTEVWVFCTSSDYTGKGFSDMSADRVHLNSEDRKFTATFIDCPGWTSREYWVGQTIGTPQRDGFEFLGWTPDITVMPAYDVVLTANWKAIGYTITFDANGGFGTMSQQIYEYNYPTGILDNGFDSETGLVPESGPYWFLLVDGNKIYVSNTDEISTYRLGNVTLYARWDSAPVIVSFDANCPSVSGTMKDEPYRVDVEKSLRSNELARTGYRFIGWSESPSATSATYSDGQLCSFSASARLYAVWEANTYTVHFVCNGATGGTEQFGDKVLTYDVSYTLGTLTRTGYQSYYWVDPSNPEVHYTTEVRNLAPAGTVTLAAIWIPITYYLVFEANSSEAVGTMSQQTVVYDQPFTLDACAFTLSHYEFQGWSESPAGSVAYTDKQQIDRNLAETSTYIHLYAVWTVGSYKVVQDPGEGEGYVAPVVVRYFEDYTIPECRFTMDGMKFTEWRIIYSDGTYDIYHPGEVVQNLADGKKLSDGSYGVVLVAMWTHAEEDQGDELLIMLGAVLAGLSLVAGAALATLHMRGRK